MKNDLLSVALDYSDTPGGRYEEEGPNSGERFRDTLLLPGFLAARASDTVLTVSLDAVEGYATSFLEEAFGGLVRKLRDRDQRPPTAEMINRYLKVECHDVPLWADDARRYIQKALKACGELVPA